MKSFLTFIGILLLIVAISAVIFGSYMAIGYIWQLYVAIDSTLRLILLSSFAVFLLGCFLLNGAVKLSAQLNYKGRLSEVKINLYKTVTGLYESVIIGSQASQAISQKQMQIRLDELNVEMCLIADSSVIKVHRKLETALNDRENEDKIHALYQQLVRKMRQDLGHVASIDETRLPFLMTGDGSVQKDSRNYGVSV